MKLYFINLVSRDLFYQVVLRIFLILSQKRKCITTTALSDNSSNCVISSNITLHSEHFSDTLYEETIQNIKEIHMLIIKRILILLFFGSLLSGAWNAIKPLPKGLSFESPAVPTDSVTFLTDLTFHKDGNKVREQQIFEQAFQVIDSAESFAVLDLFLFNNDHPVGMPFDSLAQELTDRLLDSIESRHIKVVLVTDQINTFYGAYENPYLQQLKEAGAEVVITDISKIRDSNPLYSGFYRLAISPFGVSTARTLTNPFSVDSPNVSISSMLRMLNFKANHRKLIITEKGVLAASANPHDASSNHSNIALYIESPELVKSALEAEQSILNFSGSKTDITAFQPDAVKTSGSGIYSVRLLTERRILERMLESINQTVSGDRIDIGVFYLSHRVFIRDLIEAAGRGVKIRIVLDANKDAFGRQKNGIPNRQTAQELVNSGVGNIEVRWYLTQGEQFHSKLMKVAQTGGTTLFGGSCNFTRRNFEDLNLEADFMVSGPSDAPAFNAVDSWFERIWTNKDGIYTGNLDAFADKSVPKIWLYRFMESTGLCTF